MPIESTAVWIATFLLTSNGLFQAALAAGAPWGQSAYGGRVAQDDGSLPSRYRVASFVAVPVMALLIWVIHAGAGLVDGGPLPEVLVSRTCTGAAVLFTLNTAGNLTSSSTFERWVMGSVTVSLAVCFALVGLL